MEVTLLLKHTTLLLVCVMALNIELTQSRTTKSKRERTTSKKLEATTSSKSLLDIPQNDIYNNQVDEHLDIPLLPVVSSGKVCFKHSKSVGKTRVCKCCCLIAMFHFGLSSKYVLAHGSPTKTVLVVK